MLPDIKGILKPRPRKYRHIARHLSPILLTGGDSAAISEADLFNDLTSSRGTERFLGSFSKLGIQYGLKQFGVYQALANAGLKNPLLHLDTSDSYKHLLRLAHRIDDDNYLSGEMVARKGKFNFPRLPGLPATPGRLDLIIIEWLLLQHPLKEFSRFRPQLPGQEHPGLGIGQLIYETLYWTARRSRADGVLVIPNYLHTGLFYGRQFLFIDPVRQGLLQYIEKELLRKHRLDQVTWACSEGQLVDVAGGTVFQWEPAPMLLPVSLELKDYFSSPEYTRRVHRQRYQYQLELRKDYRKRFNGQWKAVASDDR